ncbi:hypothetical protein V8E51_013536 [Hyaloscypha variabilis]
MVITGLIAWAILAQRVFAVPVQNSSPSVKDSRVQKHQIEDLPPITGFVTPEGIIEVAPYPLETTSTGLPFDRHPDNLKSFPTIVDDISSAGSKKQLNTTVSSQHRHQPLSNSAQRGYDDTEIEDWLDVMFRQYSHEGKYSKRWMPRLDTVGKELQPLRPLKPVSSTNLSDDDKAQIVMDQLEYAFRNYHKNGYKYSFPHIAVAAIHKAKDSLHRLNITGDASLRYSEKLRAYCYQIHGSQHRQESCARQLNEKVTGAALHSNPSWNSTAILGKRAVMKILSEDVSASQTAEEVFTSQVTQPSSVESFISKLRLAYCPGQSVWKPAEQFEDLRDCALYTHLVKHEDKLERRDDDPSPDPAWLKKFLYPEQHNSLPKRNEKRWEFEASMNLEYEDPQSHETAEFDVEASRFPDWEQIRAENSEKSFDIYAESLTNQSTKRYLTNDVRKLENKIETKIAKPWIEFKNATKDATDAIQDAVERFTARMHKHKYHVPGNMNITATLDPSKHRKRGLQESVRKLENEVGSEITEPLHELTEPSLQLNNSTKRDTGLPEEFLKMLFKDEDFRTFVHNLFNNTFEDSPQLEFDMSKKVLEQLYKHEEFRTVIDDLFIETSGMDNSTACSQPTSYNSTLSSVAPRMHARDIKRSEHDHGNCHDFGIKTPNEEFSRENAQNWFDIGSDKHWREQYRKMGHHPSYDYLIGKSYERDAVPEAQYMKKVSPKNGHSREEIL